MALNQELENKDVSLLDILDAVLDKGVAIKGDLIISIADIDLVYLDLKLLITSVETMVNSRLDQHISSRELEKEKGALEYVTNSS